MHGPPQVGWSLVVLGSAAGGYCLLRLRRARGLERGRAASEAVMGLGMAAMALPVDAVSGRPWSGPLFAVVFAAAAVHGLVLMRGRLGRLHHPLGCLAMVYMALAMPPGAAAHHSSASGGLPLLTGLLLAYYTVHVLRGGLRLAPAGPAVSTTPLLEPGEARPADDGFGPGAPPELPAVCRLALGIGMLIMLLAL